MPDDEDLHPLLQTDAHVGWSDLMRRGYIEGRLDQLQDQEHDNDDE